MSIWMTSTDILRIKKVLSEKTPIIGVSGPSGSGKDYLIQKAIDYFSTIGIKMFNVQEVTERKHRGITETKTCISPSEYDRLQESGKLIGDHVNKVRYGYLTDDIKRALESAKSVGGMVILELNPSIYNVFLAELRSKIGVDLTVWIGVETTLDQARKNLEERFENERLIKQRLGIMSEFMKSMEKNKSIIIVDNGPDNRTNSHADFIKIIKNSIHNPNF